MNRLGQALVGRNPDQCAIREKGIVQCYQGVFIAAGEGADFVFQTGQSAGEIRNSDAVRLLRDPRKLLRKMAIDKNQAVRVVLGKSNAIDRILAKRVAKRLQQRLKGEFRERLETGESPVLITRCRISVLSEAGKASLAKRQQLATLLLDLGECLGWRLGQFGGCCAAHAASLISQS